MKTTRALPILAALAAVLIGAAIVAGASSPGTRITAEVAPDFSHEGLEPGDPLAAATLLLYDGNRVVLTSVLDENGATIVEPEPGVYDVQVRLDSAADPLCFWGETAFGIEFPSSSVELQAGFICAGG